MEEDLSLSASSMNACRSQIFFPDKCFSFTHWVVYTESITLGICVVIFNPFHSLPRDCFMFHKGWDWCTFMRIIFINSNYWPIPRTANSRFCCKILICTKIIFRGRAFTFISEIFVSIFAYVCRIHASIGIHLSFHFLRYFVLKLNRKLLSYKAKHHPLGSTYLTVLPLSCTQTL